MSVSRKRVAILGATGNVGQRLIEHLAGHPWFDITHVAASERSAGRSYREACDWRLPTPLPGAVADLEVRDMTPAADVDLAFSALDAAVADTVEPEWARAGVAVFSNARSYRMAPDVPLVISEVNAGHLDLLPAQRAARGFPGHGGIVTNANCSATFLTMALAPLHQRFGVRRVLVATLQAVSGAGYRGVSSMEILGNVVPFIGGEEEKLESETQKMLGTLDGGAIVPAPIAVSAHTHRVAVLDGHTEAISVELVEDPGLDAVKEALRSFRAAPQEMGLPSAPDHPIVVLDERDRPQPLLDLAVERSMATVVGRIRPCPVFHYKMVLLGHNTIRGAGPGSVLNAELMAARGLLGARP
ncbi:MAG: aspartate-semialdehyde dehydrogenase [Gemmatimonadota bacterium]